MGGTSAVLALLGRTGQLEIWQLALASFIKRCGWCTDNPVRRVMIGEVVGRERMSTAMSLDVGASNASRMVGPAAGGFLLDGTCIQGAFILSVLMYCTALWAIMTIRSRPKFRSATTSLQVGEAFLLRTTGTNLSSWRSRCTTAQGSAWPVAKLLYFSLAPGLAAAGKSSRAVSELSNDRHERRRVWAGEPIGTPCPPAPTPVSLRKLTPRPRRILPLGS